MLRSHHQGVGAVVGGLAGLGIGSLIGGGSGRDAAMVLVSVTQPVNPAVRVDQRVYIEGRGDMACVVPQ